MSNEEIKKIIEERRVFLKKRDILVDTLLIILILSTPFLIFVTSALTPNKQPSAADWRMLSERVETLEKLIRR